MEGCLVSEANWCKKKKGADYEWQTPFGDEYDFQEDLGESLYPIYAQTIIDLMEDGAQPLDGLLIGAAFFGVGVNVQEEKNKKKK